MAPAKTEGPSIKLVFLGIELDTASLTLSLPQQKLDHLQRTIQEWGDKRSYTKRELLSIIGQLQYVCCIVKQGTAFPWYMIELSRCIKALHHKVWLNTGFHSDLKWWGYFLAICRRSSRQMLRDPGGGGGGGVERTLPRGEWFQLELPGSWREVHITVKEVLPIVLGVAVWGPLWKGLTICC